VRVCVCVCVWSQDKLKAIADICFLLGSYVDLRKIQDEFACVSVIGQGQVIFQRVQGEYDFLLMDMGSVMPFLMASFLLYTFV